MGNIADLNVSIGGDVKPLNAALDQAKLSLIGFKNLATSLRELQPFAPFVVKAIAAAKTVEDLKLALKDLQYGQSQAFDPKELYAYNNAIAAVKAEIKTLTSSEQQLAQANKAVAESNAKAAQSASGLTGSLSGLSKGFSFVRQAAYLLPGIGLAGIFNLAFDAISKAATALGIFGDNAQEVADKAKAENIAAFNKELDGVAAGALSSGIRLQEFVRIARDGQLPIEQRNTALKEANAILGEHGQKLTLVNINSAAATTQVEHFTEALIQQAIAAKYSDKIADIFINQRRLIKQLAADFDKLNSPDVQRTKFQNNDEFGFGSTEYARAVDAVNATNKAIADGKAELAGYKGEFTAATDASTDLFSSIGTHSNKAAKSVKTVADIIAELNKKFEESYNQEELFGGNLDPQRIDLVKNAIKDLLSIGVPTTDDTLQQLKATIDDLQTKLDKLRAGADLFALKGGGDKLVNPIKQKNPVIVITDIENPKKYLERATQESEIAIEKMRKSLQAAVSNVFENIFESIGQSLGDAISGKGNPFEALGRVLGDGIKAIGAQLIKFGVAAEAVKLALKNPFAAANPFLLIAGGVALEAIGSAISNLGITPHADGGIFTKPTLIGSHLFGEKGPEALVPLSRMSEFGAGNSNNHIEVTGSMQWSYNGIRVMFERADKYTQRNYGNFNGK